MMDHASLLCILEHAEKLSKNYLNLLNHVPQNGVAFQCTGKALLAQKCNLYHYPIHWGLILLDVKILSSL